MQKGDGGAQSSLAPLRHDVLDVVEDGRRQEPHADGVYADRHPREQLRRYVGVALAVYGDVGDKPADPAFELMTRESLKGDVGHNWVKDEEQRKQGWR